MVFWKARLGGGLRALRPTSPLNHGKKSGEPLMTLHTLIEVLHVLVCLALIGVVMVQASEGEGLSGAFGGGGSYALFGKRGATGFIAKATTTAAVVFMLTSFALAYQVRSASGTTGASGALPLQSSPTSGTPDTGAPLAAQ